MPATFLAEALSELAGSRRRILDRIVQKCRSQDGRIGDTAFVRQGVRERKRMIDVGRGIGVLAALVSMPLRSERGGPHDERSVVHGRPPPANWRPCGTCTSSRS